MKNTGSIFAVTEADERLWFLWCVGADSSQLNSDLIVVLSETYEASATQDFDAIVGGEIDFYCHVFLGLGVKLRYWKKVAHRPVRRTFAMIFRDSDDYGNPAVRVSQRWYAWRPNEPFQMVGRLPHDLRSAEPGIVVPPDSVIERIRSGRYGIQYPTYDVTLEARI